MEFVKLNKTNDANYSYLNASSIEMNILGDFFSCDILYTRELFRQWIFDDSIGMSVSGNISIVDKEDDYICLTDIFSQGSNEIKMTRQQLSNLIDEWQEKVCILKPQEVIIKHDNDKFWIETSD